MDCLNPYCERQNEVLGDYPLCKDCAPSRHFEYRNDCCCVACQVERSEINASELLRLETIAFNEEIQYLHGRPIAAAA